jgi:hypothetical protein
MEQLSRMGVRFSKKSLMEVVNLKFEDEMKAALGEDVLEAKERQRVQQELGPAGQGPTGVQPSQQTVQQFQDQQEGKPPAQQPAGPPGPGQPGGPPAQGPPPRPGTQPQPQPQPQPAQQQAAGDPPKTPMRDEVTEPHGRLRFDHWQDNDRWGNWDVREVEAVVDLFRQGRSDEAFWAQAASERFTAAVARDDREEAWDDLQLYLESHGYPDEDVASLRAVLAHEGVLAPSPDDGLQEVFDALPEDIANDAQAEEAFRGAFRRTRTGSMTRFATESFPPVTDGPPRPPRRNPFRG